MTSKNEYNFLGRLDSKVWKSFINLSYLDFIKSFMKIRTFTSAQNFEIDYTLRFKLESQTASRLCNYIPTAFVNLILLNSFAELMFS